MKYFLILVSFVIFHCANSSQFDSIKQRLKSSAAQLSLRIFLEPPDAPSYLNVDLVNQVPHKLNLTKDLTKIIRQWKPQLLALDATSPYYFSTVNDSSAPTKNLNLLAYLQAVQSNSTPTTPFLNVLPQSYRHALPLFSMFQCSEHVYPKSGQFFHNVQLLVGPGRTELKFERKSKRFSQLYCSLYGWPEFILINQPKQPKEIYDSQRLLKNQNLSNVEFTLTNLAPGSCLHVPAGWVVGAQLNNSISIIFTVAKVEQPERTETEYKPWPCTSTSQPTLDAIDFTINDSFNLTEVGLIVYFYQYLNPPMFDQEFHSKNFIEHFRNDKNVSQLILKWTPELNKLIEENLFQQLDINQDGKFSVDDYYDLAQSTVKQIQNSILQILEQLREIVLDQYNELQTNIAKMSEQLGDRTGSFDTKQVLQSLVQSLPESVKEQLREKNLDVKQLLDQLDQTNNKRKRPTTHQQQTNRVDDDNLLFNQEQDRTSISSNDEEEEILAEPHRIDL